MHRTKRPLTALGIALLLSLATAPDAAAQSAPEPLELPLPFQEPEPAIHAQLQNVPAEGLGNVMVLALVGTLGVVEVALPDVWWEQRGGADRALLAWGLPITWGRVGDWSDPVVAYAQSLAEVHWLPDEDIVRGLFTGRLQLVAPITHELGLGLIGEAGWVVGGDGEAPVYGGGLVLSSLGLANLIAHYRHIAWDDAPSNALTLQLEVPLPAFLLWQDL